MYRRHSSPGFTLIELIVVIAIISILSAIALTALSVARQTAQEKAALAQIHAIRTGIGLLESDTGKWPNGCLPGNISSTESISLATQEAGLVGPMPSAGTGDPPLCEWTPSDTLAWKGPYIPLGLDPWKNPYRFVPNYPTDGTLRQGCPNPGDNPGLPTEPVIVSGGPDNTSTYCDDHVLLLQSGKFLPEP